MSYSRLLHLIYHERWGIRASHDYKTNIFNLLQGKSFFETEKEKEALQIMAFNSSNGELLKASPRTDFDEFPRGSVALIRIDHVMTKFGNWCMWGTENYANLLLKASEHENIIGAIIAYHTPGGAVSSVFPLENAIEKTKESIPVVTVIDSNTFSCGYYNGCQGKKVIAIHPMAELGSIGVMAMLVNDKERMKEAGLEILEIYPEESKYKNLPVREALKKKFDLLIEDELKPLAISFQEHVKKHRGKKLDLGVEGLLEGKTFFAKDALEYGLIDGIGTMETALEEVLKLANRTKMQQTLYQ